MTPLSILHVAWRSLIIIVCLTLLVTSLALLVEERNTAYLFGLAFGAGAYYAARDLRT